VTDWTLVAQAREGIARIIGENPETVTVSRAAMVDDGFGGLVADPHGARSSVIVRCRLSHESRGPVSLAQSPAGLSTNLARFILVDHLTTIIAGDTFEALGRGWKIGAVDPLLNFGAIIGYQAPLVEASEVEVST
jgi:hypothetical protein